VLYTTAGPVAQYCPATKGVGYGYAKIDSPTSFRQVFIDKGEKTIVTTKKVTIGNGRFVVSDEQSSTFSERDNPVDARVNTLTEQFFK
jgi:hypothetical protein